MSYTSPAVPQGLSAFDTDIAADFAWANWRSYRTRPAPPSPADTPANAMSGVVITMTSTGGTAAAVRPIRDEPGRVVRWYATGTDIIDITGSNSRPAVALGIRGRRHERNV